MADYISRFGLERNPFLKAAGEVFVETGESREAGVRLGHLGTTHGFGVLTGASGKGKTTVVRRWIQGMNPALFRPVYSCLSTLTVTEFYRHLAEGLGAEPGYRKVDNFRAIQDEITRLAMEKRVTPVIVIDEADHLGHKILADLKILFNFEMDSRDRAIVLLVGLPQLNNTLNQSVHEPLRQRLVMNYHMDGMTKEEGREYVRRKLEGAGCRSTVFDEGATEAILNSANGTPRMVNKLCNAGLMVADSEGKNLVDAEAMRRAIEDCLLG